MSSNGLPEKMFDCVISNVSSNDFRARMQSHIGNICLIFLHCTMLFRKKRAKNDIVALVTFLHRAFSNVSSDQLPQKMQSHVVCIYFIFLHCAFSNVSSDHLPQKMQSLIVCIYFIFLHCAFSNVSSDHRSTQLEPSKVFKSKGIVFAQF